MSEKLSQFFATGLYILITTSISYSLVRLVFYFLGVDSTFVETVVPILVTFFLHTWIALVLMDLTANQVKLDETLSQNKKTLKDDSSVDDEETTGDDSNDSTKNP